jgi:large repetitive protein
MNLSSIMKPNPMADRMRKVLFSVMSAVLLPAGAQAALQVTVVDDAGSPINDFRWILQEDNSSPGVPNVPTNNTVSIVVHKSDARPVATGHGTASVWPVKVPRFTLPTLVPEGGVVAGAPASPAITYGDPNYYTDPDPTKRYIIQVMTSGYSMGGQLVAAGQSSVQVVMNRNPLPTAQVSILVFHDHNPINNEPDAEEEGLAGFRVSFFDQLGGPFIQDAFANPIGTEYATNTDGSHQLDPGGAPIVSKLGDGYVYTDKDGKALIKNMWNGKFGVQVIPPTGENWTGGHASLKTDGSWWQTATIEGTPFVDAWVPANGARVFIEGWGAGSYHVFFGFVDPGKLPGVKPPANVTGVTLKGRLRYSHFGRPPQTALMAGGPPVTDGWIGLNQVNAAGASGQGLLATPCDPEDGTFEVHNVAPGSYELVSWDRPLDAIWNFVNITVPANAPGGVYDVGDVFAFRWFGTMEGSVFADSNGTGFPQDALGADKEKIPGVPLNLRFRDGTIYQSTQTKVDGNYSFTEVFPFFKWLVAEVDNGRWKSSGLTTVVDDGGVIPADAGWGLPSGDVRNPQKQYAVNADGTLNTNVPLSNPNTGNPYSRTQTSASPSEPVLTQAIQLYHGQNSRIDWGKANYGPGESGGISGIVCYNNTRAEADPRYAVQELWDPGIARVQVALYAFETNYEALAQAASAGKPTVYGQPADINLWKIKIQRPGATTPRLADVDNYPFGWATGGTRGPEDIDQDDPTHALPDAGRVFNPGDALQITHTDSWDDDVAAQTDPAHPNAGGWPAGTEQMTPPTILGRKIIGSDNLATWNQVRPGVFDGAYVLNSYHPGGMASGSAEVQNLPPGDYVVQASPPRGYLIQTEESRNIVFGDAYTPSKLDIPAECIGEFHLVPPVLNLFADQGAPADFANQWRPLADRKLVTVVESRNAPCNFNMYTEVPKAARVVGLVMNDLSAEFDPSNPNYGEKEGPGWIPISFRDWAGHEVARVYADEYGSYEAMLPSTYNAAVPCPSGYAPTILTVILNDPTMPDPANPNGPRIPDPNFNPGFTTAPVPLEYFPGSVNYADTPIVPIGAFVGSPNATLDIEPPNQTPVIANVAGTPVGGNAGPYVGSLGTPITLTSLGLTQVLDPNYTLHGNPNRVPRDYGFGATPGTLLLNGVAVPPASVSSWTDSTIVFTLPAGAQAFGSNTPSGGSEWQLMVRRGDNSATTPIGITLSYEPNPARVHVVAPVDPATIAAGTQTTRIQDAVDAAQNGDLIIVPASQWAWNEYVILYKPLRLQGSGYNTLLNGTPDPEIRVSAWHDRINQLLGQDPFLANECPSVQVLGQYVQAGVLAEAGFATTASRVDGFTMKSAIHGGGVQIYNRGVNLRISNNRITGNRGAFAGGISIGMQDPVTVTYDNPGVLIEYNQIVKNSSGNGAGGIGIYTGATGYKIRNNYIMGNFATSDPGGTISTAGFGAGGGGIGHEGLSPGGLIANNVIAFNEVYFGYSAGGGDGGGIYISGEADGTTGLGTTGSGSVTIINNLIQGNLAAAGLGGGIRLAGVNGPDVTASANRANWYRINIYNNMIVNNAAGFAGAGISLQDAINVSIVNNTIANNDATATAHAAFSNPNDPSVSVPLGAGVVSHPNSASLGAVGGVAYSRPFMTNDIIWHNRSFHFDFNVASLPPSPGQLNLTPTPNSQGLLPDPTAANFVPAYVDVAVAGGGTIPLINCSTSANPGVSFARPYTNMLYTAVIPDEGGNNIALRMAPIGVFTPSIAGQLGGGTPRGDYHLAANLRPGTVVNTTPGLDRDFDGELRTAATATTDRGADQRPTSPVAVPVVPPLAPAGLSVPLAGPLPDTTAGPGAPGPAEANPFVPPGPQVAPPPLNPVWMTVDPGTASLPLFVAADIESLTSLAFRLQAQADPTATVAAQTDPVARLIYTHLSPGTLGLLSAYTGGADAALLAALVADLNTLLQGPSLYPQVNGQVGYTPSARTIQLSALTGTPFSNALLNRSVIQDAFTEIRRWYDPNIAYVHLVCGDGFAVMGDSTELYTFGFSDQTAVANNPGNDPNLGPDRVFEAALAGATISAPTIVLKQDQDFHLDLSNVGFAFRPDLFDPHTVHFHGFPNAAPIFDGMPLASVSVLEGATLPYFYKLQVEGTYFYHCHVEATEHMQQGMIGNLWVEARQNNLPVGAALAQLPPGKGTSHQAGYRYAYNDGDGSTEFDVEYPIQITGFDHYFHDQEIAIQPPAFATMFDTYPLLNGRGYPDTIKTAPLVNSLAKESQRVSSLITAKQGQRVLLRVSNVSETEFDTVTVPGIPMTVVGKDARLLRGPDGKNLYYRTTSVTLGGGETTDVILDTANVQPGTYFLYTARLTQLSNDQEDYGGMMTHIVITP